MKDRIACIAATFLLSVVAVAQSGCSAGAPLVIDHDEVATQVRSFRGVVNGLWRFDQDENAGRLLKGYLPAESAAMMAPALAERHQVRVGIDRGVIGKFSDVSVLPVGWTHSLDKVVDDGRTVNIGDVVDIQTVIGTKITTVVAIARKCDRAPLAGENPDWNIGCKLAYQFGANGYAGSKYYLTVF